MVCFVYRHPTIILSCLTAITLRSEERRQQTPSARSESLPLYCLLASETGKWTMISCSQVAFRIAVPLPVRRLRNRVTVLLSKRGVLRTHIPVPGQPVQTRSVESVQTLGTVPAWRPRYGDVTSRSGPRAGEGLLPT